MKKKMMMKTKVKAESEVKYLGNLKVGRKRGDVKTREEGACLSTMIPKQKKTTQERKSHSTVRHVLSLPSHLNWKVPKVPFVSVELKLEPARDNLRYLGKVVRHSSPP